MLMHVCVGLAGMSAHLLTATGVAETLPPKDGSSAFVNNYGLGFSQENLYLSTGDSIYLVDLTDPPGFTIHMSDLELAFGGGRRASEGSFTTGPAGQAAVSMGFADGGVLLLDLNTKSTTVVPDINGDGFDNDNVFSLAIPPATRGTFAMWADRNFPASTATLLYQIDQVMLDSRRLADPSPGDASGGLAFDVDGNLFVGTFTPGAFPDPIGDARFFRISATDLAAFASDGTAVTATFLGQGSANGNGTIVVTRNGQIFFNTSTGIGRFEPLKRQVTNFYRDILDRDLYDLDSAKLPLNGLAYDFSTDQLVFAAYDTPSDAYHLVFLDVPEPASSILLFIALLSAVTLGRHRRINPSFWVRGAEATR